MEGGQKFRGEGRRMGEEEVQVEQFEKKCKGGVTEDVARWWEMREEVLKRDKQWKRKCSWWQ